MILHPYDHAYRSAIRLLATDGFPDSCPDAARLVLLGTFHLSMQYFGRVLPENSYVLLT